MPRAALFLAVLLAATPGLAQEPDCESPQDQTSMNICAGRDYEAADAELNAQWAETLDAAKGLDADLTASGGDGRPGYEESLRKAQRAWIAYRDAACEYEGFDARGGSMEPMLVSGCLARLTRLRTLELRGEPLYPEEAEGEAQ